MNAQSTTQTETASINELSGAQTQEIQNIEGEDNNEEGPKKKKRRRKNRKRAKKHADDEDNDDDEDEGDQNQIYSKCIIVNEDSINDEIE